MEQVAGKLNFGEQGISVRVGEPLFYSHALICSLRVDYPVALEQGEIDHA